MITAVGIKRLGLVALALAIAGICAVLILPFLMSADAVRDAVKAEIRTVTGSIPCSAAALRYRCSRPAPCASTT